MTDAAAVGDGAKDVTAGEARFASKLYGVLSKARTADNLIVSPASIRAALAMAYLGAEGSTELELQRGLELPVGNKSQVAQQFAELLSAAKAEVAAEDEEEQPKLKYANRIYVTDKYALAEKFQQLASKYFGAAAESVSFEQSTETAQRINAWVEQQTNGLIKELVSSSGLNAQTAAMLINAIYFKADWRNNFEDYATSPREFLQRQGERITVDTMYQSDYFNYAQLPALNATAVELPYRGTDIVFMIILPQQQQGLAALESKLEQMDLHAISSQLRRQKVELSLPKFKFEFDVSLQQTLEQLGLKELFSTQANFGSMLQAAAPLHISEVKHKAYIELNEKGTSAAGATFVKVSLESYIENEVSYEFKVDHPFFFAIKNSEHIYFMGHVNQLS
ncbi:serine protease inhibitor 42Dd isoform X2 [Drosophila busckii]|nr:serine protease inhibitor 42Dd isoform X2 [Drosophila busckii]